MKDQRRKVIEAIINAQWGLDAQSNLPPEILRHLRNRNAVFHMHEPQGPLPLRSSAMTIGPAVSREEALPIQPMIGNVDAIEEDDTLNGAAINEAPSEGATSRRSGTVTFRADKSQKSPVHFYSGKQSDDNEETGGRIAMPPGFWMAQIIRAVFFFSRKTPRMFEELQADYSYDMIRAEANGATAVALWLLRVKYWGALVWMLGMQLPLGVVGKIISALIRG
jgi:hypothetical protein